MPTLADLRKSYPPPRERAVLKTQHSLDAHMRRFISLSPFLCLGTSSHQGADVTPRGDAAGFVHVADDSTLLIPDWPGNNRLDSLANIIANPEVALLFFVPGVTETLRVNGTAEIVMDEATLQRWTVAGQHPRWAIRVTAREAVLHCVKALIRSRLWDPATHAERTALAPYGQMLKDQTRVRESAEEIQASVEDGYRNNLY